MKKEIIIPSIYFIVRGNIWFGIDGFFNSQHEDKQCTSQLRIFLPFLYIGKAWGETPSGLSLNDTKCEFGMCHMNRHI
jgi:hypothetical protein